MLLTGAALFSVTIAVLFFFPATWLAALVAQQTGGRVNLIDAQGTFWHGSALIGIASDSIEPVTPFVASRFFWRFSPAILLGKLDASLENPAVLSQPVQLRGDWHAWQISPGEISLPASRLITLGAPLNTIRPSGAMHLMWGLMRVQKTERQIDIYGAMNLKLNDIASQLSPVKPLGSYALEFDWIGRGAQLMLATLKGPMRLSGSGHLANGDFQFSGQAKADTGQEEKLANLLNLLGQRQAGDQHVIALEFK